jgi:hypothetical protein
MPAVSSGVRPVLFMVVALLIGGRVGSQPSLDYCAAVAPLSSPPSEREQRLLDQVTGASRQLDLAFELFESLRPELSRANASKLFWLTVRHWLEVKQALCSCPPPENSRPGCERLEAELDRSCEIEPPHRGINVRCLTKGR